MVSYNHIMFQAQLLSGSRVSLMIRHGANNLVIIGCGALHVRFIVACHHMVAVASLSQAWSREVAVRWCTRPNITSWSHRVHLIMPSSAIRTSCLAPLSLQSIKKATAKVSSTETGVIFGSILWEGPYMFEACVIPNDIHIDIMGLYQACLIVMEFQVCLSSRLIQRKRCNWRTKFFFAVPGHVDRIWMGEQAKCE